MAGTSFPSRNPQFFNPASGLGKAVQAVGEGSCHLSVDVVNKPHSLLSLQAGLRQAVCCEADVAGASLVGQNWMGLITFGEAGLESLE